MESKENLNSSISSPSQSESSPALAPLSSPVTPSPSPATSLSSSSSLSSPPTKQIPLDMETSDEWTILSVSPSNNEIRLTRELDLLLHKDDQSDIEEIDEQDENNAAIGNLSQNLSHSVDQVNQRSMEMDNLSHSYKDDQSDPESLYSSDQRLLKRRRFSHGNISESPSESPSESSSTESDIEPVDFSNEYPLDQETSILLQENYGRGGDEYDDDDADRDVDEMVDLNLVGKRNRAYIHTPNSNVNLKLNLMVCFAITAGIFLGLGNYIGWSTNWRKTKAMMTLNNNHIAKLRSLQDELVVCMNAQSKGTLQSSSTDLKVCHQDADYWKEKFDTLFRENKGLKDILVETQKHYWQTGHHKDIFSPKDCSSGAVADEFHKLSLDLLVKQMEHLQVLKTFEEVKYQEKLSREKLKKLEEENSDLKTKLIEEEEDDKIISSTLEGRIKQLELENSKLKQRLSRQRLSILDEPSTEEPTETDRSSTEASSSDNSSENIRSLEAKIHELSAENVEFKKTLQQLMTQLELVGDHSFASSSKLDRVKAASEEEIVAADVNNDATDDLKVDALRQIINSMAQENDELNYMIARLRWSQTPVADGKDNTDQEAINSEFDVNTLEYQIHDLQQRLSSEREEVSKWKSMYEEIQTKLESSSTPSKFDVENAVNSEWVSDEEAPNSGSNSCDNNKEGGKFYDWLSEMDFSKLVGDSFSSGSKMLVDAMKMIVEKATDAQAAIPEAMHQKINSTMSTLDYLQEKMWEKWSEVRRIEFMAENPTPEYQQAMNEMTDLLINSLRKLHEIGTKFATNIKPIPQKIDKLTSKMSKILENLESKWRKNKDKLYRAGYSEPDDKETSAEELEEIDNWYTSRAKSRRKGHQYIHPSDSNKGSWLFKRARDREAQRVKGDQGETRGRGF